jgi:hypothetical protein
MATLSKLLIVPMALILCTAPHAADAEPTLGVYFDAAGTVQSMDAVDAPGDPVGRDLVEIFVVVHGVDDLVDRYGFGFTVPEGVTILTTRTWLAGDEYDGCGYFWDLDDLDCIVNCGDAWGWPLIARFTLGIPEGAADVILNVGAPADPWVGSDPYVHGCTTGLVTLAGSASPYGPGAAVVNPSGSVSRQDSTWSRIKALY